MKTRLFNNILSVGCYLILIVALLFVPTGTAQGGYGNTTAQEYGDALYRQNSFPILTDLDHSSLFGGMNGNHELRVIQCSPAVETFINDDPFSGMTNGKEVGSGNPLTYWGAYNLSNVSQPWTFTARKEIMTTAVTLTGYYITYPLLPTPNCLDYYDEASGEIDPWEIAGLRCDGVNEYCYEYNDYNVWGKNGTHYDISDSKAYCDEHNDFYDPPYDPDTETAPVVQRGAAGGTSTYLTASASVDYPTFNIWTSQDCGQTYVFIDATDQSGIHYIRYKIGDSGTWQISAIQSQHPYNTMYRCLDTNGNLPLVTESCYLYYWAMDNAGNYSGTDTIAPKVWIDVLPENPPSPPSMSSVSNNDTSKIHVEWNTTTGGLAYKLYRAESSSGPWTAKTGWQSLSEPRIYDDTDVTPGKSYYYAVAAQNSCGNSARGSYLQGWRKLSPPTVSASDDTYPGKVYVSWGSVSGASHYRVYRSTTSDGEKEGLGVWQSELYYDDTNTVPGTTYYYWVKAAVDNYGGRPSEFSSYNSGRRKLLPPNTVSASQGTYTDKVRVTWDNVYGASTYRVYRSSTPSGGTAQGTWQTSRTYDDDPPGAAGTTYYYWVKAGGTGGANPSELSMSASGWKGSTAPPADTTAPSPAPTWHTAPYQLSRHYIYMISTISTDSTPPIEYEFDFVDSPTGGSGATDSGWQPGHTYDQFNLEANHEYGYRVRARDSASVPNVTGYSSTSYSYTDIETPMQVDFGTITTSSINVRSNDTFSNLDKGSSGLKIFNITTSTESAWGRNYCTTYWSSSPLSVNTRYGFEIQARNGDADTTDRCETAYAYTLANAPGSSSLSNITQTSIQANWTANGNPAGTEYCCENTTNGTSSGWITETSYDCIDLTPDKLYSFSVKARNGDHVDTSFTSLGSASTLQDNDAPDPNPMTWAVVPYATGTNSTSMTATTATDVCAIEYYFEETSGNFGGTDSGWQSSTTYIDAGLDPNTTYSYRVKARDKSTMQNATLFSAVQTATTDVPKEPIAHLKWSQPPIEIDPSYSIPVYSGWDDGSLTFDPNGLWNMVADDFRCLGDIPVTSIHWWGSYQGWEEYAPPPLTEEPIAWHIGFWSNLPDPNTADPHTFSSPQMLLWQIPVTLDRVTREIVGSETYPYKTNDTCFQYTLHLNIEEYFRQGEFLGFTMDDIFWISIAAIYQPGDGEWNPWGWTTRPQPWMENAIRFDVTGPLSPQPPMPTILDPLANTMMLLGGMEGGCDVSFELDTDLNWIKWEQAYDSIRHWQHYENITSCLAETPSGSDILQIAADDWQCERMTPVTAIVWWGSYDGYGYEPGGGYDSLPPDDYLPDAFNLAIWTDMAADDPGNTYSYSHPDQRIWECTATDFDEVVVGYEKWVDEDGFPVPGPLVPVFRYSLRLPAEQWFYQDDQDSVYWLSIAAAYQDSCPDKYLWGWTSHKHMFNDDAVTGELISDPNDPEEWDWVELYDQANNSEDMSFVMFTLYDDSPDRDDDGILNEDDNCPDTFNPDQLDSDVTDIWFNETFTGTVIDETTWQYNFPSAWSQDDHLIFSSSSGIRPYFSAKNQILEVGQTARIKINLVSAYQHGGGTSFSCHLYVRDGLGWPRSGDSYVLSFNGPWQGGGIRAYTWKTGQGATQNKQILASFTYETWYIFEMERVAGGVNVRVYDSAETLLGENSLSGHPDDKEMILSLGAADDARVAHFDDAYVTGDIKTDHFGNVCDNCPYDYNPSQLDSDQDGSGNACDDDCPNLDGLNPVDLVDFARLSDDWQLTAPELPGDLNSSGTVDLEDLCIFATYWLADCYE